MATRGQIVGLITWLRRTRHYACLRPPALFPISFIAFRQWSTGDTQKRSKSKVPRHDRVKKPRVLHISFGETDDWAHEGRYNQVLASARRTDGFIETLWDVLQSLPEYAGKTSLVLTTDHGRGDTQVEWNNHG